MSLAAATPLSDEDRCDKVYREYPENKNDIVLPVPVRTIVTRYAPLAVLIDTFFQLLRADITKQIPYPKDRLERAWEEVLEWRLAE